MEYQTKKLFLSSCLAVIGAWYMPCRAVAPGSFDWQVAQVTASIEENLSQSVVNYFRTAVRERDYETVITYYIDTYWYIEQCLTQVERIPSLAAETAVETMRKKYVYDVILTSDYSAHEFEELRRYALDRVLVHPNRGPGRVSLLAIIDEGLRNAPTSLWDRYLQKCKQTYQSACSWMSDVDIRTPLYTACGYVATVLTWTRVALVSLWNRCRS